MRMLIAALAVAMSTACLANDLDSKVSVELYDVSDLATIAQDFGAANETWMTGIDLVEVVKAALPGVAWGSGDVWARANVEMLEVRGDARVQAGVRDLLSSMRANRGTMIQVDTKVIEFDPSHSADLLHYAGIDASRKRGMCFEHVGVIASPLQMQVFLAHVEHESRGGWLVSSPRIVAYHGQQASITIAQQTAYLQGYEERHDGDAVVSDPVIGTFTDGLFFNVRVLRPAEGTLLIAGTARTTSLLAMEKLAVTLANGVQATIETPHVTTDLLRFNWKIKEGESLLVLGGTRRDGKAAMWLITPSVVPTGPAPR